MREFNTSNLPVYLAVHADEEDKGNDPMENQVEIDEVDLNVERVCPQLSGVDEGDVVVEGWVGDHHHLQLIKPWEVVDNRENYNGEDVEDRWPGSRELNTQ